MQETAIGLVVPFFFDIIGKVEVLFLSAPFPNR
ncbi:hypothetical protein GGQ77_000280 [Geobacillus thermodenitrificans]|nr:hypothetical protein [Geobacillus thermodenitrificans]